MLDNYLFFDRNKDRDEIQISEILDFNILQYYDTRASASKETGTYKSDL